MQRLLAVLILYHFNLRILHWRLTGPNFDPVHSLMGDYYEKFGGFIDDVAEIGMQVGTDPINVTDAVHLLESDGGKYMVLNGSENFDPVRCFEKVNFIFESTLSLYETTYSDSNLPEDISNALQEHAYWIRKELRYKNKRRMQ